MPAKNVGVNSTFEQQRLVINEIAVDVDNVTSSGIFAKTNAGINTLSNVGIGTTNPTSKLSVTGDGNFTGVITASSFRPSSGYIQAADGTNSFYIYGGTGNVAFQGTIGASQINSASGYKALHFGTTPTPSVNITNDLNVGVGLSVVGVSTFTNGPVLVGSGTSTGTASQTLQITGGGYFSGNVGIGTTIATEALSVLHKLQILNNSNADGRIILRAKPGNSYRWNIDNDGDTNNFRFFREDDATAANGAAPFVITPTGNATLSGNLNAAGNYYVKLARTSNQTINNGSDTLIGFSAISDGNSWFNSGNNRITPTVAGNYYVSAMVNWAAGSATNVVQSNIQIRKTGTTIALSQIGIQTHPYTMNITAIATLNGSTDYIELTAYTGNPTSQVVTGDASGTLTKLELFKLN